MTDSDYPQRDELLFYEHYITFRNRMVSQLECDRPAACWHLTSEDIDAAIATISDDVVALPENWQTIFRLDRHVFQRADRDHYIVLGDGVDEWLIVLCSQDDRAYPAPLAHRTVAVDGDVERVIRNTLKRAMISSSRRMGRTNRDASAVASYPAAQLGVGLDPTKGRPFFGGDSTALYKSAKGRCTIFIS